MKKNISIESEGSVNTAFYPENLQLNIPVNSQLQIFGIREIPVNTKSVKRSALIIMSV